MSVGPKFLTVAVEFPIITEFVEGERVNVVPITVNVTSLCADKYTLVLSLASNNIGNLGAKAFADVNLIYNS